MLITESDIRRMVSEVISELSPELLARAKDKAENLGRYKQSQNFEEGEETQVTNWLNCPDVTGSTTWVSYPSRNGVATIKVFKDGIYRICMGAASATKYLTDTHADFYKVTDKARARALAKWWSKYGSQMSEFADFKDWHNWCIL